MAATEKSRGHICFAGRFEFFNAATSAMSTGVIMRAPANAPLDVDGFRMGGRFEGTAAWWNRNGAAVVAAFEPKKPLPLMDANSANPLEASIARLRAAIDLREELTPTAAAADAYNAKTDGFKAALAIVQSGAVT